MENYLLNIDEEIELRKQLVIDEGSKLFPYHDTVGKVTIGIGRNLTDCGIRPEEEDLMLKNDILKAQNDLHTYMDGYDEFPMEVKSILINMCFNMGIHGLMKFQRTIEAIRNRKYMEAAQDMSQSLWAKQVGNRAKRLIARMRVI
jgi:lysozyme